jgi:hypothetical protein
VQKGAGIDLMREWIREWIQIPYAETQRFQAKTDVKHNLRCTQIFDSAPRRVINSR